MKTVLCLLFAVFLCGAFAAEGQPDKALSAEQFVNVVQIGRAHV